jgi:Protein kinase domain
VPLPEAGSSFMPSDPPPTDVTATLPPRDPATAVTLPDARALQVGAPPTVGEYDLLGEIARGGMGVVFRARQRSANRVVALKMILSGNLAGPADLRRFRAEAEAAANLDHPNILPVYEVGEHDGRPFFSMKLAPGGSLADRVKDLVANPPAAAAMVARLARAVHFAHQRGILHRDLKPGNVLLDADGSPLITDFGLAKRTGVDSGITQSGAIVGTPSYMAPEQARGGKQLTTAVDVYALGAILYELLTGRPPFRADSVIDTLFEVMEKPPVDPLTVSPRADRDLCAIALKCLEKDPSARYESADELADDVDRWTAGEPTRARPLGPAAQIWRWVRRHTTAAITLPALGLVMGIWPALITDVDVNPELLPASLTTPLGWYRLIRMYPAVQVLVALISLGLFAGFGWLVVRVTRPTTVASAFGFAAAVAAVAAVGSAMYTAPLMMDQAHSDVADGHDRLHPVGDDDPDSDWSAQARKSGSKAWLEAEYLKQYLPPEKQDLEYEGRQQDIRKLRQQAARANRIRAGYRALGDEILSSSVATILWAMLSTWMVVYLDRVRGRRWGNLILYFELAGPTLFALALFLVSAFSPPSREDLGFFVVTDAFFAVAAVLALIGVVRRWRWWVRWGLYALCTTALMAVATVIAIVQSSG